MWPVAELLPHAGSAILLDAVIECDAHTVAARAVIEADGLYAQPDGSLPPWAGLELMAQAVAAWAGWQARQAGESVRLGFLVGTRRYECHAARFQAGSTLTVRAQQSLHDASGMGVFECTVHEGTALLAQARLNVYQPSDPATFVKEPGPSNPNIASPAP